MFIELFLSGVISGFTALFGMFILKKAYYWFNDKYIDIGSPWDEQIQSSKDKGKW